MCQPGGQALYFQELLGRLHAAAVWKLSLGVFESILPHMSSCAAAVWQQIYESNLHTHLCKCPGARTTLVYERSVVGGSIVREPWPIQFSDATQSRFRCFRSCSLSDSWAGPPRAPVSPCKVRGRTSPIPRPSRRCAAAARPSKMPILPSSLPRRPSTCTSKVLNPESSRVGAFPHPILGKAVLSQR